MRRGLGAGLVVAIALIGVGCASFRGIVRHATSPRGRFVASEVPAAPDYADPAAWSALPGRTDAADALPLGLSGVDQSAAPADVFYVHPTSYVGRGWNGPVDDARLNADTDRVATGVQAPAFNGCCAIWAPRYRQVNGAAFLRPDADGARAADIAYQDVKRAFERFEAERGAERPFVLAGHSQGAILAERLLVELVAGTPRREKLVVAVLPGGTVTQGGLRTRAPDVPPCRSPTETGCVVAWNARGPGYVPHGFELALPDPSARLCTNPLSWRLDGLHVPARENPGAVFLENGGAVLPGFADARCVDGTLVVRELGPMQRDLPSRILDAVMGPENYHPVELQLYFASLRENVNARVEAWRLAHPVP